MTLLRGITTGLWQSSTEMPEFMDGSYWPSTPESFSMDECRKNPVSSTKTAVFVDGEVWLSTIMAVYVDKWQKNRHPSTFKPDYVDGEIWSSMKTALYVDDSRPKVGLITLKEVDPANATNIFCCSVTTVSSGGQAGGGYICHRLTGG